MLMARYGGMGSHRYGAFFTGDRFRVGKFSARNANSTSAPDIWGWLTYRTTSAAFIRRWE